jgi:cobalt-zinc-cadmium efflux system outer membrane protein
MRITLRAALAGAALLMAHPAFAEPLTLDEAVRRAVAASPALQAGDEGISAERAGRMQAAARPNPVISVEAENFSGTGPYMLSQSELTVTYEQQIERGGKRDARIALADRGIGIAEARLRVARLDLAQQVQRAFIDVQIAAEASWLAQRRLTVERELREEALRRVRGYKDPLFVESRANARVAEAELAVKEAEARDQAARAHLASFWGGGGEGLELPEGIEKPDISHRELAAADAALNAALIEAARAGVVLQQTAGVQDYSVSGGARYLRDTGDVALVAGVSIPLGRFDRNRGNIERAQAERRQMELAAEADRLDRLRRLASLRAEAEAARLRAEGIMQDVYPSAAKALEQVREGYNRGGFQFNDVQEAANAIVEAQAAWVEAMARYRDTLSEIDRLTGRFDAAPAEEIVQ